MVNQSEKWWKILIIIVIQIIFYFFCWFWILSFIRMFTIFLSCIPTVQRSLFPSVRWVLSSWTGFHFSSSLFPFYFLIINFSRALEERVIAPPTSYACTEGTERFLNEVPFGGGGGAYLKTKRTLYQSSGQTSVY